MKMHAMALVPVLCGVAFVACSGSDSSNALGSGSPPGDDAGNNGATADSGGGGSSSDVTSGSDANTSGDSQPPIGPLSAPSWISSIADSSGKVGSDNGIAVHNGALVVGYWDLDNRDLKFATALTPSPTATSDWQVHSVEVAGDTGWLVRTVSYKSGVVMAHYNNTLHTLRIVRSLTGSPTKATDWRGHDVDTISSAGKQGGARTAIVELNGMLWLNYFDFVHNELKVARALSQTPDSASDWQIHSVASATRPSPGQYFNTMAIANGRIGFVYDDTQTRTVNYARALVDAPVQASDWQIHTIDSWQSVSADLGAQQGMTVLNGLPVVAYRDAYNKKLKVAIAKTSTPSQATDWAIQSLPVQNPMIIHANVVQGRIAVTCINRATDSSGGMTVVRALVAAPASAQDWAVYAPDSGGYNSSTVFNDQLAWEFQDMNAHAKVLLSSGTW